MGFGSAAQGARFRVEWRRGRGGGGRREIIILDPKPETLNPNVFLGLPRFKVSAKASLKRAS